MGKSRPKHRTKNQYQRMIAEYLKRREELKDYCPAWKRGDNIQYLILVQNINRKLAQWRRQLRRIEVLEAKLQNVDELVSEYFALDRLRLVRKHRQKSTNPKVELAVKVFCKYCMEHGFNSTMIGTYLGCRSTVTARRSRLHFTRSFKHKPSNLEAWHGFRAFSKSVIDGEQAQVLYEHSVANRDRLVRPAQQGRRAA